ncbi:filamentous hemagglutinin N-terminal domain-containing protein [Achromobacter xylosoxidans]
MNKIYRLKFDRRRNQLVAVSELTTGAGKQKSTGRSASRASSGGASVLSLRPLLAALALVTLPGLALANPDLPVGGQIVAGQGGISTSGNQMTIQQRTQNLVTHWQSFDVGAQNTVRFVQPDSNAVALNRVMGASGSQILGSLQANGKVIILNPNGVLFGKDAQVNVAGLLASTKNLSTADFMAGRYDLSGGSADAQVVNQGNLMAAPGGYIVLAGGQVKNSGTIATPAGKTVLAAADKVSLRLDNSGLVSVSVSGSVVNALVENTGLIAAPDGQVFLTARGRDMLLNTVVNNSGTVEAQGLESRGGEIVLDGGDSGVVSQSGRLLADSAAGQGGKVTLEGRNIHLAAAGKTSATGKTGGGQVYVGGGWQGKDGKIRNASKVVMDKAATVDVSATQSGNGGTAVLWSEDYTNFQGNILARGGAGVGNGGQVETSSRGNLQAFGDVDASAPAGQGGNWLLDPLDVAIVSDAENLGATATDDSVAGKVFSPSSVGAQVSAAKISEQLSAGTSVTVDTHGAGDQPGAITVKSDAKIKKTAGGDATLTLKADKGISFENRGWSNPASPDLAMVSTAGKLNVNLLTGNSGQDGTVNIGNYVHFNLNGGDFHAGPANASSGKTSVHFENNGTITAGNITLDTLGGTEGSFYGLIAAGDLKVNGPLSLKAGFNLTSNLSAGRSLEIIAPSGDIRFFFMPPGTGKDDYGTIAIEGKDGVNFQANSGHLAVNVMDRAKQAIKISSSSGAVNLGGKVQDGTNGLKLGSVDITSAGSTKLDGLTHFGKAALLSDVTLKAGGNIDITGIAKNLSTDMVGGADSNGVTLTNSRLTSGGNVTLTGLSGSDPANENPGNALTIAGSTITADAAAGKILLTGTTRSIIGVKMTDSTLSAASLEVNGIATDKGMGFSLENNTLKGGLADPKNVMLSAAGSAEGVTNLPAVEKPADPVEKPADPVEKPADPVEKPADPVEKPADPVEKPADPVEKPADPVEKPADPVEKPADPVEKPADPVEKPADPVEKPADPVEKPADPVEKPADPVEKPADPVEKPADPVEKPADPVEKPADPVEKPAEPEKPIDEVRGPLPQLTAEEVQLVTSAAVVSQGQSSANAQTSAQTQAPQSGFHVSGEPAVPASHYQMAAQEVDVSVCAGEECGAVKLDASKPSE